MKLFKRWDEQGSGGPFGSGQGKNSVHSGAMGLIFNAAQGQNAPIWLLDSSFKQLQ